MGDQQPPPEKGVVLETNVGAITIELYWDHSPKTCKNFYELAKKGYYNGVIFHRIIRVCRVVK
jgi:peptidyl-prolyl cis-trans isomerase-like 1